MSDLSNGSPLVSVIVPTRNAAATITKCINALLNQSYPQDRLELIFVDNESEDSTPAKIKSYPAVRYLESRGFKSPYPARNLGVRHATGSILAFTDANCYPSAQWIEEGVKMLQNDEVDLIGGHVSFVFSNRKTAAEVYDSLTNVRIKENIEQREVSKTANLIVSRTVFEQVGEFPNQVRSGGDVIWTSRATTQGYRLRYCDTAVVYKYARPLGALLRKQYRVGRGQSAIWRDQGKSSVQSIRGSLLSLLRLVLFRYPKRSSIRTLVRERGGDTLLYQADRIFWVAWLCKLATCTGQISGVLSPRRAHG